MKKRKEGSKFEADLREGAETAEPVDDGEGVGQAADVRLAGAPEGAGLLRVEQRLADVERRGDGGGDGARDGARRHVAQRVVGALRIGGVLHGLVGHKVGALERHVHHDLRAVRPVEGGQTLRPVHLPHALHHRTVRALVHLQPLLHHCPPHYNEKQSRVRDSYGTTYSSGRRRAYSH